MIIEDWPTLQVPHYSAGPGATDGVEHGELQRDCGNRRAFCGWLGVRSDQK